MDGSLIVARFAYANLIDKHCQRDVPDVTPKGAVMLTRTRQLITKSKTVLISSVVLTTMIVSLGVAVPSSSALGSSSFCQLMFTYKPISAPTSITKSNYLSWANAMLPFFEKLAADAPNT